ncbi:hypothetical protein [Gillisia sp. CAL575]|uniref:hypothetical protein n=1 Tax=Gillisia sp. CAL575 TaxID=985255 RepID=UPI00039EDF18|nr:hypothetical protein [Gillisia sp. CAL575]
MIDRLTFLNDAWSWPIILGVVVLLLVFVWKEWHQFPSTRFFLKVGVVFLGICSLAIIALKPAFLNYEGSGNLILLTENYLQFSLDSLKKEYKRIKVLKYDEYASIINEIESADTIFVLGNGIKTYDRWQLEGEFIKYIKGASPEGIIKFKYQLENTVGDSAVFTGLYSKPNKGIRLLLEGPGGEVLDSVILSDASEKSFQLITNLKSAGNYIYNLVEKDSIGTILSSDPIPIKVKERDNLKILVINGFPIFETKYLKNFLAELGHEIIVRSQVTKGKFKYEAFNTKQDPIRNLNIQILESSDLLLIDYNSLKKLSSSERNNLEKSVSENGLGVFIQPEAGLFKSNSGFLSFDFIPENSAEVSLPVNIKLSKYPFSFKQDLTIQPVQTSGKQILSAYKRMGQGKVGSSVLQNTYELLLEGHSIAYQQLWTKHINSISKRAIPLAEWQSNSKLGTLNEPFQFQVRTSVPDPIVRNEDGAIIPLRRAIDIPSLWTGTTYPNRTGWQQLKLQQDSTNLFDIYVTESEKWNALKSYQRIQENQRNLSSGDSSQINYKKAIPINLLYFYLLFLLCMGYLWLEPKLRSY